MMEATAATIRILVQWVDLALCRVAEIETGTIQTQVTGMAVDMACVMKEYGRRRLAVELTLGMDREARRTLEGLARQLRLSRKVFWLRMIKFS